MGKQLRVGISSTKHSNLFIVALLVGKQEFSKKATSLADAMTYASVAAQELGLDGYDLDGKDLKSH